MDTELEQNGGKGHIFQFRIWNIIQINAPTNNDIHEVSGFVDYVDDLKVKYSMYLPDKSYN